MLQGLIPLTVASTLATSVADGIRAKRERKFAKENWDMMNEYNTPKAQMERYREAGINFGYSGSSSINNSAPPLGDAAASVAKVEIPNLLQNFQQYYATKNAALENSRLSEIVAQNRIQTDFMNQTLNNRVNIVNEDMLSKFHSNTKSAIQSERMSELHFRKKNPDVLRYDSDLQKYQLDQMRMNNEKALFDIDFQLRNLELGRQKVGLTGSDNVFLRMLQRMGTGQSPLNSIFNYFK